MLYSKTWLKNKVFKEFPSNSQSKSKQKQKVERWLVGLEFTRKNNKITWLFFPLDHQSIHSRGGSLHTPGHFKASTLDV